MKRRPVSPSGALPPLRLLRFVAAEWPVPPLKEHTTEWEVERWPVLGPMHSWRGARRAWAAEHGDAGLGNPLERMQFERAYYSMIKELLNG